MIIYGKVAGFVRFIDQPILRMKHETGLTWKDIYIYHMEVIRGMQVGNDDNGMVIINTRE